MSKRAEKLYETIFSIKEEEFKDYGRSNKIVGIDDALPTIKEEIRESQVKAIDDFISENELFRHREEKQNDEEYTIDEYGDVLSDAIWVVLAAKGLVK